MTVKKIQLPQARHERIDYIKSLFPEHQGKRLNEDWMGGRIQGLNVLANISPKDYGATRNYLDGRVTRLSPYLRHGCITLTEAIAASKIKSPDGGEKLLFEFAWRDFWRQVWFLNGDQIFSEMETPKVKLGSKAIPTQLAEANSALPCMDAFVDELHETGYLHNHARMWLASFMVHWLKIDWKLGSDWMHNLLLDGDYASNTLSWQWIASSFGSKPYFFNKENLSKYTSNRFCENCKAKCPFNDSYENLDKKLFSPNTAVTIEPMALEIKAANEKYLGSKRFILFHDEMLSNEQPLYKSRDEKIFIFDPNLYKNWALHRLQFIADCLSEIPEITVWIGTTESVLNELDCGQIETQNTPSQKLKNTLSKFDVNYIQEPLIYSDEIHQQLIAKDVRRFSKYWNIVSKSY
jgi:deoxyribodipyrimidine photo-lyase